MFCSECGEPIPEGRAFCRYCGAPAPDPVQPHAGPRGDEESDTLVQSSDPSEAATVARGPGWDQSETLVMSDPTEAATLVRPPAAGQAEAPVDTDTGSGVFPPAVGELARLVPPPSVERTEIRPGRAYLSPRTQTTPLTQAPPKMQGSRLPPPPQAQLQPEAEPRRGGRGILIAGVILLIVILAAIAATVTILVLDSGSVSDSRVYATVARVTATWDPAD